MKKILFTVTILLMTFQLIGQEKGSYITLSGGVGPSGFLYVLDGLGTSKKDGFSKRKIGWQGTLGYSYFFTQKVGISTGIGVSQYRTMGGYDCELSNEKFLQFENIQMDDDNGENYYLRARLGNWKELQKMTTIEIPLMVTFQQKFGKYQSHGIYLGLGFKFQIPVKSTYTVQDGKNSDDLRLNVSGYYPGLSGGSVAAALDLGAPDNKSHDPVDHGFGSIHNPSKILNSDNKMSVKFNVAGTVEGGFLFGLSRRVDLNVAAYLDYGFVNIQKESKDLMEVPDQYQPNANGNIGYGVTYNGIVNSKQVDRINTISYGGKIGIRVKLGNLEVPTRDQDDEKERLRREEDSLMRASQMDFNDAMLRAIKDLQKGVGNILTWKDMVDDRLKQPVVDDKNKDKYPYGMSKDEYQILTGEHTYFTLNSAELRSSQKSLLDRKIEIMKKYPEACIQVAGNTCDLGTAILNGNLGLFRAKAVRDYMISKGVLDSRILITTQSYNMPLVPNTSEENRSQNRRCDYEILPAK